jgi:hypothetical protein
MLVAARARTGNWLDTDVPLSDPVLADIAAAGYEGVYRYVPLPGNNPMMDISPGELQRICSTRRPDGTTLQCGLIQHPRSPENNNLTLHPPSRDAAEAADVAVASGYPLGCHLGLDFEGLFGKSGELRSVNTRDAVFGWGCAWGDGVLLSGFLAQLYLGYDVPLSAADAYDMPPFTQYWSDAGHRVVATRGCSMSQGGSVVIHGVQFDRDVLAPDLLGDVPMVATLAA